MSEKQVFNPVAMTSRRRCPYCGADTSERVFPLAARDFAAANWTYRRDFADILEIDPNEEFPVVRCSSCAFVFAQYLPSPEFLDRVYDRVIDRDKAHFASLDPVGVATRMAYVSTIARLVASASPNRKPKALDFGCGFGVTARLLAELDYRVVVYDPSSARSEIVRRDDAKIEVIDDVAKLAELGAFEVLVLDNVLEHVPDPMATMRDLAAVCAPGAIGYLSVPSYEQSRIRALTEAHRDGACSDMTLNPWEHLNYFDVAHLDGLMARAGFSAIEAAEASEPVDIGLRPENALGKRLRNVLASCIRAVRYGWTGKALARTERRFYRLGDAPHQARSI